MNFFFKYVWLMPFVAATPAVYAQQVCPLGPIGGDAEIDAYVESERQGQYIQGMAIAVVYGDAVAYQAGFGEAGGTAGPVVFPQSTLFRLASVSKSVTAVAGMIAREEGYLDLDLPVGLYYDDYELPDGYLVGDGWGGEPGLNTEPLPGDAVMTLRHLLSHQAGVQHYSNGVAKPTPPQPMRNSVRFNTGFVWALDRWTWAPLLSPPGEAYSYTTMGFNLAGAAIGQAWSEGTRDLPYADRGFTDLVEERIAVAAGAYELQPDYYWKEKKARSAGFIILAPGVTVEDPLSDVSWKLPGGGFMASAQDMGCFARALMDDTLLPEAAREEMWAKQTLNGGASTGYGLGFGVGSRGGHRRVSHNGEQEGATSRLVIYPDDGLAIVIMTNTRSGTDQVNINLTRVANGIEDIVRERVAAGLPAIDAIGDAWGDAP